MILALSSSSGGRLHRRVFLVIVIGVGERVGGKQGDFYGAGAATLSTTLVPCFSQEAPGGFFGREVLASCCFFAASKKKREGAVRPMHAHNTRETKRRVLEVKYGTEPAPVHQPPHDATVPSLSTIPPPCGLFFLRTSGVRVSVVRETRLWCGGVGCVVGGGPQPLTTATTGFPELYHLLTVAV